MSAMLFPWRETGTRNNIVASGATSLTMHAPAWSIDEAESTARRNTCCSCIDCTAPPPIRAQHPRNRQRLSTSLYPYPFSNCMRANLQARSPQRCSCLDIVQTTEHDAEKKIPSTDRSLSPLQPPKSNHNPTTNKSTAPPPSPSALPLVFSPVICFLLLSPHFLLFTLHEPCSRSRK
ncbi:hypothetical protein FN846DRAFT_191312 [Sphaerosporella brunnea]|uniref:Uncharacterized protein n=1 Tax=Sphaerosporella brunnea TaxID=1250544 RepID=A0A5J5ER31_9PEZI|nr:hypothetical protein FN846DRAFT_191312 [Sphaerosporella brunnea]